jgi:mono/diheme cytochrome c family protein
VPPRLSPVSPFGATKARALMRDRFPCAGCHAVDGRGGRLGPDLSGVAQRRSAAYVRRMVEDPQSTVPGTMMPKVPMPAASRDLIIAYLTGGADSRAQAAASRERTAERAALPAGNRGARAIYGRFCAPCHGAQGRGDGPNASHLPVRPAAHADSAYMSRRTDDRLFDAIYSGGHPLGRSATMPAFGETLTALETWSLVSYLRELCRCSGPAWSTDGDRRPRGGAPR